MKDYLVIQAEDGARGVHSPDVEGVFALGATREEAAPRIAEALSAHLAGSRRSRLSAPLAGVGGQPRAARPIPKSKGVR